MDSAEYGGGGGGSVSGRRLLRSFCGCVDGGGGVYRGR